MEYDTSTRTFDCAATLTDSDVLRFCREGYLLLPGAVPDAINRRTLDYLEHRVEAEPAWIPDGLTADDLEKMRRSTVPSSILLEPWFIEHVVLNRLLCGVLRSLLGPHVGLPVHMANHRVECPNRSLSWHNDGDHVFGPEMNYLEVFYFPQDTPTQMGPTEVMPGSHIHRRPADPYEAGVPCEGPAGTFGIHVQSILHRRSESTATGVRHMLKFNYWRKVPPRRDWIIEPDFDLQRADYGGHGKARYCAHMFYWLCGKGEAFRTMGGQAWPWSSRNQIGPSYGFGLAGGYLPDWRRDGSDGYALPPASQPASG